MGPDPDNGEYDTGPPVTGRVFQELVLGHNELCPDKNPESLIFVQNRPDMAGNNAGKACKSFL